MNKEEKLAKAIAFAAEKHAGQTRRDGTPYIYHPLAVAELLKRYGYDVDYQVAGVLHDVLEDTDATDEEVKKFGENVYEAVKLVTRPKGANETEYVKDILANRMAAAVKNADKIHNMCDIVTTKNKAAILKYAKKVEKYYKEKFSYALDNAIRNALYMRSFCNTEKEIRCCIPDYTMAEMALYSDREKVMKEESYKLYTTNTDVPDLSNPELKFAIFEYGDGLICYSYLLDEKGFVGKTWELTKGGWEKRPDDSKSIFCCGLDIEEASKEDILDSIDYLFEKKWFFDFVKKDKILCKAESK